MPVAMCLMICVKLTKTLRLRMCVDRDPTYVQWVDVCQSPACVQSVDDTLSCVLTETLCVSSQWMPPYRVCWQRPYVCPVSGWHPIVCVDRDPMCVQSVDDTLSCVLTETLCMSSQWMTPYRVCWQRPCVCPVSGWHPIVCVDRDPMCVQSVDDTLSCVLTETLCVSSQWMTPYRVFWQRPYVCPVSGWHPIVCVDRDPMCVQSVDVDTVMRGQPTWSDTMTHVMAQKSHSQR